MEISKEKFGAYVRVQMSGVTNMFAVDVVSALSGLTKDECFEIMEKYEELDKKYPEVCGAYA